MPERMIRDSTCDRCEFDVNEELDGFMWKVKGHGYFCELCNEKLIEHGHFTEDDGKLYRLKEPS